MMTFLKTILIVLLVYFGLKFIIKFSWPYILRYITKKAGQKFEQAFNSSIKRPPETKEEGSISIDKMPSSKTKSKSTEGEYVDYEEIE